MKEYKTISGWNYKELKNQWMVLSIQGWHVEKTLWINWYFRWKCKLFRYKDRIVCLSCRRDAEYNGLCWQCDFEIQQIEFTKRMRALVLEKGGKTNG